MAIPNQGQVHVPRPRHSGQAHRRPVWYVANEALLTLDSWDSKQAAIDHGTIDPIAFLASNDPDVMYYDLAMKAPDAVEFSKACKDEIAAHHDNGNWEVVKRTNLP